MCTGLVADAVLDRLAELNDEIALKKNAHDSACQEQRVCPIDAKTALIFM